MNVGYWWERQTEGDQDVRGWIIIEMDLRERWGSMDWIVLVKGKDVWRALVITAVNLLVP
jgi:hypothetical protein